MQVFDSSKMSLLDYINLFHSLMVKMNWITQKLKKWKYAAINRTKLKLHTHWNIEKNSIYEYSASRKLIIYQVEYLIIEVRKVIGKNQT